MFACNPNGPHVEHAHSALQLLSKMLSFTSSIPLSTKKVVCSWAYIREGHTLQSTHHRSIWRLVPRERRNGGFTQGVLGHASHGAAACSHWYVWLLLWLGFSGESSVPFLIVVGSIAGEMGGPVMVAEARTCESQSHRFKGPCARKANCASVCNTEGFPDGYCHGVRRRCMCTKPCPWSMNQQLAQQLVPPPRACVIVSIDRILAALWMNKSVWLMRGFLLENFGFCGVKFDRFVHPPSIHPPILLVLRLYYYLRRWCKLCSTVY